VLEKLAAVFFDQDANRLPHLPSWRAQHLEAADARHQQRDAAVAGYADAFGKAIEGLQFETGKIDALQLFGGIQLASGPSVGRAAFLHFVAAHVFIVQAFQPLAQFFRRYAVGDVGGQLGRLEDFVLDEDGTIDAQSERQRV